MTLFTEYRFSDLCSPQTPPGVNREGFGVGTTTKNSNIEKELHHNG